jgi:hypothetical protein
MREVLSPLQGSKKPLLTPHALGGREKLYYLVIEESVDFSPLKLGLTTFRFYCCSVVHLSLLSALAQLTQERVLRAWALIDLGGIYG